MDINQYNEMKAKIDAEHRASLRELKTKYARTNNKVAVGDIVTDHIGTIKVDRIEPYLAEPPYCVYWGAVLKKDGTPRKDGMMRYVHQVNMKYRFNPQDENHEQVDSN